MAKLRLALEDLSVESFDSTPSRHPASGTVRGHQQTETCFNTACGTCYTVEYYCGDSLDGTCDGTLCVRTCGPGECPVTYDATCPAPCRTQGVYC